MARTKWLLVSWIAVGCSNPSTGSPQPEPVYYPGDLRECAQVESTCLSTDPPQCFEYCADGPPKKGSACSGEGDVKICGDEQCVVGEDAKGTLIQVCVGMDCTVSYEAATGKETIACASPSDGGLDDSPGSADGSSGP